MGLLNLSFPRSSRDPDATPLITCDHATCPIPTPHKPGPYYHKGKALDTEHAMWGDSNPPPAVWRALERYQRGSASAGEIAMVVGFCEGHGGEVGVW